jgi:sec-independent protein translocase protein TatA
MGELLQPMHLAIIAVIVIFLFGGRKLPELGKGLGEGLRSFKEGMKGVTDDPDAKPGATAHTVTPVKPEETIVKETRS